MIGAVSRGRPGQRVTPIGAILWTRTSGEASVTVDLSRSPDFTPPMIQQVASAQSASAFTVKAVVAPLVPGTTYAYRFRAGSAVSGVGTFQTAPNRGAA